MVKIHGIVYIIMGIFVSIASYRINYDNLLIFFYLGFFFIALGAAKIVLGFIFRKNKEEKNTISMARQNYPNPAQRHQYKRCHKCSNITRLTDRFCSRCGTKMYASMLF
jgi:uncharacterized paraquat-inducible protein A